MQNSVNFNKRYTGRASTVLIAWKNQSVRVFSTGRQGVESLTATICVDAYCKLFSNSALIERRVLCTGGLFLLVEDMGFFSHVCVGFFDYCSV